MKHWKKGDAKSHGTHIIVALRPIKPSISRRGCVSKPSDRSRTKNCISCCIKIISGGCNCSEAESCSHCAFHLYHYTIWTRGLQIPNLFNECTTTFLNYFMTVRENLCCVDLQEEVHWLDLLSERIGPPCWVQLNGFILPEVAQRHIREK